MMWSFEKLKQCKDNKFFVSDNYKMCNGCVKFENYMCNF